MRTLMLGWIWNRGARVASLSMALAVSVWMWPQRGESVSQFLPQTSLDKIEAAEASKALSGAEVANLKAALLLDPESLPEAYWVLVNGELRPVGPPCGTPLVRECIEHVQDLSPKYAEKFMALKVQANAPAYKVERTYDSPGGQFKIHYSVDATDVLNQLKEYDVNPADGVADDSDGDGVPDLVEDLAVYFDHAYSVILKNLFFWFMSPIRDGSEGGDNRLDVYLKDLTEGTFGVTYWETGMPYFALPVKVDWMRSVLCSQLDTTYGYIKPNLKGTCAHEFFHSVQYSYDLAGEPTDLIAEGTAMWMEDAVYDDANSGLSYLPGWFEYTDRPTGIIGGSYETFPYWKLVSEFYGTDGTGVKAFQGADQDPSAEVDTRGVDFIKAVWEETTVIDELGVGVSGINAIQAAIRRTDEGDFFSTVTEFTVAAASKLYGSTTWQDFLEDDELAEPFTDENGNNAYDLGESYTDSNLNGQWDSGYPNVEVVQQANLIGNDSLNLGIQSVSATGADFFLFKIANTVGTVTFSINGDDYVPDQVYWDYDATLVSAKSKQLLDIQNIAVPMPTNAVSFAKNCQGYDEVTLIVRGLAKGGAYTLSLTSTAVIPPPTVKSQTGWMKASNASLYPMIGMEIYGTTSGNMAGIVAQPTSLTEGYLPHYQINTQWWTGVAFANANSSPAVVDLTAYGNGGLAMGTQQVTVPAKGQYSKLVSSLFDPKSLARDKATDDPSTGWIKFKSSVSVSAVEIYGNTKVGGLAALASPELGTELYIPHVVSNSTWWTGISIVNVDFVNPTNLVKIESYTDAGGTLKAPIYEGLLPGQKWVGVVSSPSFLGVTNGQGWIKVVSQGPVVAMEVFGKWTSSGIGGLASAPVAQTVYLPRLVRSATQSTGMAIINTSSTATTVTIEAYDVVGQKVSATWPLAAKAKLLGNAEVLVPTLPASIEGYLKISATQPLSCMELIYDTTATDFACDTGVATTASALIYPHFASGTTWWTQYSVSNLGAQGVQRMLEVYDPKGNMLASSAAYMARGTTYVGLLSGLLP